MHQLLYSIEVKLTDLERKLKELGWWEIAGGKHAKWTNGSLTEPVPRHKEIDEYLAKKIIRRVASNPPEGK